MSWLIYGAYGYTGGLVVEEVVRRALKPVLAGRREAPLRSLAQRYDLEWKAFSLDDAKAVDAALDGVEAVLHCAGPFELTSKQMVDGCLRNGAHYLDITGEIAVFEACFRRDEEAKLAGITVLPGVGLDVVPSDCLAAALSRALPDATELDLAIYGRGPPSQGTTRTALRAVDKGGAIRREGRIVPVPAGWKTMDAPFSIGPRRTMSVGWGDVSTAYHSTGIPNIVTYMKLPKLVMSMMGFGKPLLKLVAFAPVRAVAQRLMAPKVGPDAAERARGSAHFWGEARNPAGKRVSGVVDTPDAYALTALTALACMEKVLAGDAPAGFMTPSKAFGADLITEIEGCTMQVA